MKICPECGRELIKRKGKYGQFYGCQGFPHCVYTEQIDGAPVKSQAEKDADAFLKQHGFNKNGGWA